MSDSPARSFRRLRELFERLTETPRAERDAELARSTVDDPALAAELRALLEAAERPGTPLDAAALRLAESGESLPTVPGFQLRRRIGRGGSATVYLAEQERADFQRQVALKVVDRVVDPGLLRRVREEQRILARLEHPGIARLYDAGLTAGEQPYLAMGLVQGESILAHARARRLSVRERLDLFLAVLDAVAFAHAAGVVHRDLKPANILISERGEAKLLDFGIAKLIAPDGTPEETQTVRRALPSSCVAIASVRPRTSTRWASSSTSSWRRPRRTVSASAASRPSRTRSASRIRSRRRRRCRARPRPNPSRSAASSAAAAVSCAAISTRCC